MGDVLENVFLLLTCMNKDLQFWSVLIPQLWTLPHCQQLSCQRELGSKHICFFVSLYRRSSSFSWKLLKQAKYKILWQIEFMIVNPCFFFFLLACLKFSNKQTSVNSLEMQIYFISREFSFIFDFFSCLPGQPSLLGITIIFVLDSCFLPFITFSPFYYLFGGTSAEVEAPILWQTDLKS